MQTGCASSYLTDHAKPTPRTYNSQSLKQAFIHNNVLVVTGFCQESGNTKKKNLSLKYSLNNMTDLSANTVDNIFSYPSDIHVKSLQPPPNTISVPIKHIELSRSEVANMCKFNDFSQIAPDCTSATILLHPIFSVYYNLTISPYKKETMWFLFTDGTDFSIMQVPAAIQIQTAHYNRLLYLALPVTIAFDIITSPIQLISGCIWTYQNMYR